uniref:Bradykinin-potentiating peptide 10e n=1 Tax=Bothrops cotiara TaxID=8727 RepID=BPPAE_BOTCO|nr:RecName: Full=Bradykinin-potentiating peptide 10e; Short=BPP-10e [Bothrops cotiara]
QNWPSPKVPP